MVIDSTWPGFFLVIDGIDGSGKSTQTKLLAEYFTQHHIPCYLTTEPSSNDIGKLIRQYLKKTDAPAAVDALLFAADRVEHCFSQILPELKKKKIVISDRFLDSSLVYQSIQGKDQEVSMEWIKELNKFSFLPDLTIIIDILPEVTMARKAAMMQNSPLELEKFENENFLEQVRQGFLERVQAGDPLKYAIIDGDQSIEEVTSKILELIQPLLKKRKLLK